VRTVLGFENDANTIVTNNGQCVVVKSDAFNESEQLLGFAKMFFYPEEARLIAAAMIKCAKEIESLQNANDD